MPPEELAHLVTVGVWVMVRVRFGGNQKIAPEENCPLVSVRVRVWEAIFLRGNCPRTRYVQRCVELIKEIFEDFRSLFR